MVGIPNNHGFAQELTPQQVNRTETANTGGGRPRPGTAWTVWKMGNKGWVYRIGLQLL